MHDILNYIKVILLSDLIKVHSEGDTYPNNLIIINYPST